MESIFPSMARLEFLVSQARTMQEAGQKLQDELDQKEVCDTWPSFYTPTFLPNALTQLANSLIHRMQTRTSLHIASFHITSHRITSLDINRIVSCSHSTWPQIEISKLELAMREAAKDHDKKMKQLAADHKAELAAKDQAMQDQAMANAQREAEQEAAMSEFRAKMEAELLEARTPPPSDDKGTQCDTIGVRYFVCFGCIPDEHRR